MRVVIIGGGASGVMSGIEIKRRNPNTDVIIIERNEKLLKKIYATGNGKCNFANASIKPYSYSNYEVISDILNECKDTELISFFEDLNVISKRVNDLVYPYSESAETIVNALLKEVERLKITIRLNENFIDYIRNKSNYVVKTSDGEFECDAIIFATALGSAPQLGNSLETLSILQKHRYETISPLPGLCPIKVKENVKLIEGLRQKVAITLFSSNKEIYKEEGEILFKKDGISGIVTFNVSSVIARLRLSNYSISIDFAPALEKDKIIDISGVVSPRIAKYLEKVASERKTDPINLVKDFRLTYTASYEFDYSQVSVGGILLSNVHENLESKNEPKVYFVGEVLDVDGLCGGYNLMWAFASAHKVAKNF